MEQMFHCTHHVRVPAALFDAALVQQLIQCTRFTTNNDPQSGYRHNEGNYDQNGGKHGSLVGFLKTRLDANVNWMEDDREHDGYENGGEKRPDDQKTEIECNRGQDQQEEGSRYLLPFHWRTALPVKNSAYHGVHVCVGGRKHTSYQG